MKFNLETWGSQFMFPSQDLNTVWPGSKSNTEHQVKLKIILVISNTAKIDILR